MYSEPDLKKKVKINFRHRPAFFSKKSWQPNFVTMNAIYSILVLLFGVVLLLWPVFSFGVLKIIFGLIFIFGGGIHLVCFLERKFWMLLGILLVFLGMGCFFASDFTWLYYFLSAYMISHVVEHLLEAFSFYRHHEKGMAILISGSGLLLLCAILLSVNPFLQMNYYELMGSFIILFELIHLTLLSLVQKKSELLGYN